LRTLLLLASRAFAAAPFHEDKTIRIIVGYEAGGGFDAYSRTMARHIGKYIPGSPTVIVDNMVGAGGLIAQTISIRPESRTGLLLETSPADSLYNNFWELKGLSRQVLWEDPE
jgi:tripartite-type tricarboxylate transporter receptor subunit TctC